MNEDEMRDFIKWYWKNFGTPGYDCRINDVIQAWKDDNNMKN